MPSTATLTLLVELAGDAEAKLQGLTGGLGALAVAAGVVVGALAGVTTEAAKWETTLTQVQNNTTATTADIQQMDGAIRDMAAHSSASLPALASGFEHVMNEGYSAADATIIVNAAMKSAVATGADVGRTINVIASIMREYGMNVNQVTVATDLMHNAAAQGNARLQDFVDGGRKAISTAANLGVSLSDVTAVLATLTKHFGDVNVSSTQVVGMLTHIINPTKAVRDEIAALAKVSGVDLTRDFSLLGLQARGLPGVLQDISKAVGGNKDEIFKLIPALRGGQGALALIGMGADDLNKILLSQADILSGKSTPTADAYARTQATLGEQMGQLKNKADLLGIALGETLTPAFTGLATQANAALGSLLASDAFGQWAARTQGWISVILQGLGILAEGFSTAMGAIIEIVGSAAQIILHYLMLLSPFTKNSPSLIEQVTDGMAIVKDQYVQVGAAVPGALAPAGAAVQALGASSTAAGVTTKAGLAVAKEAVQDVRQAHADLHVQIVAMEAALGPYKTAVKAAADALKDAEAALRDATGKLKPFTDAVKDAERAQKDIETQIRQTTATFKPQEDAIKGAERALKSLQDQYRDAQIPLRQFEDAVKDANTALKTAEHDLKVAEGGLDSYKRAVKEATDALKDANAALKAQEDQLKPLTQAVKETTAAVHDAEQAIKSATASLAGGADAIKDATLQLKAMEAAYKQAQAGLAQYQTAVKDAQAAVQDATAAVSAQTAAVAALQAQYGDAQKALNDFKSAQLQGQEAQNDKTFANKQQQSAVQLALDDLKAAGGNSQIAAATLQGQLADLQAQHAANEKTLADQIATTQDPAQKKQLQDALAAMQGTDQSTEAQLGKALGSLQNNNGVDALKALNAQLTDLQTQGAQLATLGALTFDPLTKAIKDTADKAKELTFAQIIAGVTDAKGKMSALTPEIAAQQAVLAGLKGQLDKAKGAYEAATAALAAQQATLVPLQQAIADQKDHIAALQAAYDALKEQTLGPLETALAKAKDAQDAATEALAKARDGLTPYQEAVQRAKDAQDAANTALQAASDKLEPYRAAIQRAQEAQAAANTTLDAQREKLVPLQTAITDQQTAIDKLKTAYDDARTKALDPLNAALDTQRGRVADAQTALDTQRERLIPYTDAVTAARLALDKANEALAAQQGPLDALKTKYAEQGAALGQMATGLGGVGKALKGVKDIAQGIADKGGIFSGVVPGVGPLPPFDPTKFQSMIDDIKKNAQPSLDALKLGITNAVKPLQDFAASFKEFADKIAPVGDVLKKFGDNVPSWIGPVGGAVVIVAALGTTFLLASAAVGALGVALGLLTGPIGIVLVAIGLLTLAYSTNFLNFKTGVDGLVKYGKEAWKDIGDGWDGLATNLKTNTDKITNGWSLSVTAMEKGLHDLIAAVQGAMKDIGDGWDGLGVNLDRNVTKIVNGWNTVDKAIKDAGDSIGRNLKLAWDAADKTVKDAGDSIGTNIRTTWETADTNVKTSTAAIGTGLKLAWDTMVLALKTATDKQLADVTGAWTTITTNLGTAWDNIKAAASKVTTDVPKFFTDAWAAITGVFANAPTAMQEIGKNLVGGLVKGLNDNWTALTDKLHELALALPEPVRKALGIQSPSTEMATLGGFIVGGLIAGITAGDRLLRVTLAAIGAEILLWGQKLGITFTTAAASVGTAMTAIGTAVATGLAPLAGAFQTAFTAIAGVITQSSNPDLAGSVAATWYGKDRGLLTEMVKRVGTSGDVAGGAFSMVPFVITAIKGMVQTGIPNAIDGGMPDVVSSWAGYMSQMKADALAAVSAIIAAWKSVPPAIASATGGAGGGPPASSNLSTNSAAFHALLAATVPLTGPGAGAGANSAPAPSGNPGPIIFNGPVWVSLNGGPAQPMQVTIANSEHEMQLARLKGIQR